MAIILIWTNLKVEVTLEYYICILLGSYFVNWYKTWVHVYNTSPFFVVVHLCLIFNNLKLGPTLKVIIHVDELTN